MIKRKNATIGAYGLVNGLDVAGLEVGSHRAVHDHQVGEVRRGGKIQRARVLKDADTVAVKACCLVAPT